jgi:hypothetical protein
LSICQFADEMIDKLANRLIEKL